MNILLVSKTAIINQIFTLITSKLNMKLIIQNHNEINESYDFIIIDEEFIDDKFNFIKQYSKRLGAIVSEELPFDKSRDFIISRPFLPMQLETLLKDEIDSINDEKHSEEESKSYDEYSDTQEVFDYVESLADDIAMDIDDEMDESIVTFSSMKDGGVLDTKELSKINTILKENTLSNVVNMDEEDWKDLSEIIDDALSEVEDYEFDISNNEPINLVLNNYNIDELKPLLKKFDQKVIDRLSSGESIDLRLSLKAEH